MIDMSPPPAHNNGRLRLEFGPRSYDIIVGEGLLEKAGDHIAAVMGGDKVIIVTDTNVEPLYLQTLEDSLNAAGIGQASVTLPAGEQSKSFESLEALSGELFNAGVDRKTTLIALGGGVIGDLVGFAAAIIMRGVDFIQIPTTLLSQVDSSVGGKTGINSAFGKNLIGAFHQPRLVLADLNTLDTLPRRQLLAGYAEVAKYGLIDDADFFSWLECNATALLDGDRDLQRHAILKSCARKAAIVVEDEREHGKRALLNLGHTFAHSLETETGYGDDLLHGEAVSIGMVLAFQLSHRLGLCPETDAIRVRGHLEKTGLPVHLKELAKPSWTPEGLIAHMQLDKKTESGNLVFILARSIGESFIARDIDPGFLRDFLKDALTA